MPPPGGSKKKKGRAPKHQNTFAFRHNPNSKKTDKILSSPNIGVCRRCRDKIEWRKKYRKYKPRTHPGKCNICFRKNVLAAYHTICTNCATSDPAIAAMKKRSGGGCGESSSTSSSSMSQRESAVAFPGEKDNLAPNDGEDRGTSAPATARQEDAEEFAVRGNTTTSAAKRGRTRVCAVCAAEPALSKHADVSEEGAKIIEQINDLEESLESGAHVDGGRRLTLREIKGVERKLERLRLELKQQKKDAEEEVGEDGSGGKEEHRIERNHIGDLNLKAEVYDEHTRDGGDYDQNSDPFLSATGGKALVGEEYQKMLLATETK